LSEIRQPDSGRNAALPALCKVRPAGPADNLASSAAPEIRGPRANCGAASSRRSLWRWRSDRGKSRAAASPSSWTCQYQPCGGAAGVGIAGVRWLSKASPASSQDSLRVPSPWRLRPV